MITGGVGWSDAVDGGVVVGSPVGAGVSDGVAVGSPVGVVVGEAGAVVGLLSEAQKSSMDDDPAAADSAANPAPEVDSVSWRHAVHRSATEGSTEVVVVVVLEPAAVVEDVVVVRAGGVAAEVGAACGGVEVVGATDGVDGCTEPRSGRGAPMVRCATSCNGPGSNPVYAAAAMPPAPSVTRPATVKAANLPAINVDTTATRRAPWPV